MGHSRRPGHLPAPSGLPDNRADLGACSRVVEFPTLATAHGVHPTVLPSWFRIVILFGAVNASAVIKRLPAEAPDDHSAYRF
jgi:hypothetical protein